jgi:PucR-like helix-turn-helix protein
VGARLRSTAVPAVDRTLQRAAVQFRADIGELAEETMLEIQAKIPEFARPANDDHNHAVRAGVEHALRRFLDILERRGTDNTDWRDAYRAIGAGEMREGRSLDALQAAIRLGGRVGWRRLVRFAESESLSVSAISSLADAIWAHIDDLSEASAEGYAQARSAEVGELDRRRRRLLDLLVADPPPAEQAVNAAALAARWSLPKRLAAIVLEPGDVLTVRPILSPEVLAGLDRAEPALIVPDPESPAQVRMIVNALGRYRAAIGPAVPPAEAADSLRWAHRALELANRGVIAGEGLVWCDNHFAELTIFQDEALLTSLVRRRLEPLSKVRENQREPLADTLLAWLQQNMNANAVAATLHVHPQTVRRRLRQLDQLFGDQVHDCDARFELEIALRTERARRRRAHR